MTSYANLDDWDFYCVIPTSSGTVPSGVEPPLSVAITDAQKLRYLAAASGFADSMFSKRYVLPIVSFGEDLREAVCAIAYDMAITIRGYNPDGPDKVIRERAMQRRKWLSDIASATANLVGAIDSPQTKDDFVGVVVTAPRSGWVYQPAEPRVVCLVGHAYGPSSCAASILAA